MKADKAIWLQAFIDDHYGLDIATLQTGELKSLRDKIDEFLATGVDTDDLELAGDYSIEDLKKVGYE